MISRTHTLLKKIPLLAATTAFFLLSLTVSHRLLAEGTSVSARLDTNQIRIGEQFKIRLSAVADKGAIVVFPSVADTLNGLEVVERGKIDTLASENGKPLTLQQQLSVTGFDSGYYVIEPFVFIVRNPDGKTDSLSTEAQLVAVKTVPVDTTKDIKDIKAVMEPPFDWMELLPWLWFLLAVVVAVWIGYRLHRRYRSRGGQEPVIRKPLRPAHEIALEEIEKLEKEKLWQQGYHKEYHIRLTDIVRMYIEQRFGVASQESTTDETLQLLRSHLPDASLLVDLERILRLADLVKFAKAIPIIHENEQSIRDARAFVVATAVKPEQQEDQA